MAKRKTTTSWEVKARYNAKTYKSINLQLKPDVFEKLEKAKDSDKLSRPELLEKLLLEDERRKRVKEEIIRIEKDAKSENGIWLKGYNVALSIICPDIKDNDNYDPIKLIIKDNEVHEYVIWRNGLPTLSIFKTPEMVYFEGYEGKIRLCSIGHPDESILKEDDTPMNDEDYLAWFFDNFEMGRDEYEKMVINNGYKNQPAVDCLRGLE